jgi:hypothetical protein
LANLENQSKGDKSSLNQHVNPFKIKDTIMTRSETQVEDDWVGLSTNPKQMVQVQIQKNLTFHYDPRPKKIQQGIGTQLQINKNWNMNNMCKKLYMFIKTNKIYRTRMMLQLMLIVKI